MDEPPSLSSYSGSCGATQPVRVCGMEPPTGRGRVTLSSLRGLNRASRGFKQTLQLRGTLPNGGGGNVYRRESAAVALIV